eukprot:TRINITY_DN1507_c0_g1_i1.p1 TRINITY_DN1507_c0_g1~~TRINITY_DN1507_c0_g1_i1.p1  ORF type:complete len:467 (+),score=258.35 TRINITY_DN1507_c0_g1_i1:79-1401(+)
MSGFTTKLSGDANTESFRIYYEKDGKQVSPFHDVPLVVDAEKGIFNAIIEIPRGTNAKMEIATGQPLNPIKQDVKRGKLRFVDNVYPHVGYIWNYGAFPQTWEDPTYSHPDTKALGDRDPLDVCEIGSAVATRGEIKQVKVLGVLAMIDEGETDWKIIAIDVNDPLAAQLNDVDDIQKILPGFTMATYEWFRTYKLPTGAPPNAFAFNGEVKNRAFALEIIEENHQFWKKLVNGETPAKSDKYDISALNITVEGSPFKVDAHPVEYSEFVAGPDTLGAAANNEGVKGHVEKVQQQKPHSTSDLSSVLDVISKVAAGTDEEIVAAFEASGKIRSAVFRGTSKKFNEDAWFTVAFSVDREFRSFGIYQPETPHSFFPAGKLNHLEVVAAAFAANGQFTYNSGYGNFVFANQELQPQAASIPEIPQDGDDLAEVIPLSFVRSF